MRKGVLVLTREILVASALVFACAGRSAATDTVRRTETSGTVQARVAASFALTGKQHLDAGRLTQAIEDFEAALSFDPTLAEARAGLAQAKEKRAQSPEAAPTTKPADPVPVEPAPKTAAAELARAQTLLKTTLDSAQHLLRNREYENAAAQFEQVLRAAKPLAQQTDVSAIELEAKTGLQLARDGMQPEQKPVASHKNVEPVPEKKTAADPPDKETASDKAEKKAAPDKEYEAAMAEAMREVGQMMLPQTKIMAKGNLPRSLTGVLSKRGEDPTSDNISPLQSQTMEDEEAANLMKAKLLKPVSVDFKEQPFIQAIEQIRATSGINIVVDPAIIPATTPVTFRVTNMELRYVLGYVLQFQNLDYRIRHGAIFISNAAGLGEKSVTVMLDISDLVVKVKEFGNERPVDVLNSAKDINYARRLGGFVDKDDTPEVVESTRQGEAWAKFIRENVASNTWAAEGAVGVNTIAYRNGKLVVTHTPEVQEQIRTLLASFRKARAIQVAILARFIDINEDFLEDFGVSWDIRKQNPGSIPFEAVIAPHPEVGLPGAITARGIDISTGFLDGWHVLTLLNAVRKYKTGNILTAPRVTCFNTQRAAMTVSTIRNYVSSYDADGNPIIGQVNDGVVLEVQPFVSADRRYITLELIPQVNKVGAFDEFTFRRNISTTLPDGTIVTEPRDDKIQLPVVTRRLVQTTVSIPDGGTLMVGGLAEARAGEGYATIPILGSIPLIKHLITPWRKVDSRSNLIILVTAHIIQQEEGND